MEIEPTLIAVFLTGLLGGVHCAGMCGGIVGAIGLLGERPGGPGAARGRGAHAVSVDREPGVTTFAAFGTNGAAVAVAVPRTTRRSVAGAPGVGGVGEGVIASPAAEAAVPGSSVTRRLVRLMPYNAGRLASYTTLGALAGAIGSFGWLLGGALPFQQGAFALTNALLILMGLYVAGYRRIGHALESLGRGPWARVRPFASASLGRAGSSGGAFVAGALWGLVPCGMVYAVLVVALLAGSAAEGAALMLAFGLGTLPNLLLLGVSGSLLARLTRRPRVRLAAGLVIALFGVLGLLRLDAARSLPIIGELCVHLPGVGA